MERRTIMRELDFEQSLNRPNAGICKQVSTTPQRPVRDQHLGPLRLRALGPDGVGGLHLLKPERAEGFPHPLNVV
jgi:hypothetical protein